MSPSLLGSHWFSPRSRFAGWHASADSPRAQGGNLRFVDELTLGRAVRTLEIAREREPASAFHALLIEPHQISRRVAESRDPTRASRGIWARSLNHPTAMGANLGKGGIEGVDPDVRQQPRRA